MKKSTALITLILGMFLLLSSSACADGMGLNSDSSPVSSLAVCDGEVYCLSVRQASGYGRIFCVTGGQAEEIYSGFSIDDIYSFSGGIVLNRSPETLDTLFNKMSANQSIEVLDPETCEIVQWDYYPAETWSNHFVFTNGTNLFVSVITDQNGTDDIFDDQYVLQQYDTPGQSRTVVEMEHTDGEYPTFHPISIEKGVFFRDKLRLTLYDYETGAKHSTKSYLKLPEDYENSDSLQAVLKDEALYYLSKDSMRVYDFSDDSDTEFLAFSDSEIRYTSFILADESLILFGSDRHLIDIYDLKTLAHSARFTASVPTVQSLLCDGMLYLYTPYAVEREDISGEVFSLYADYSTPGLECIDLSSGAQTLIPLK